MRRTGDGRVGGVEALQRGQFSWGNRSISQGSLRGHLPSSFVPFRVCLIVVYATENTTRFIDSPRRLFRRPLHGFTSTPLQKTPYIEWLCTRCWIRLRDIYKKGVDWLLGFSVRKRIITFEDLTSIWSCNQISDNIELLAPELRETLWDHQAGCICLNEFMFKVRVRVPFEFNVVELLYVFSIAPIHLTPNS
ncbi:hypothetical protein ACLOJK_023193 [Asimina triloba]